MTPDASRCIALCCSAAEHCQRFADKPSGQWVTYTDYSEGLLRASCPMFAPLQKQITPVRAGV